MSDLTLYQKGEIQSITSEALEVIESHPVARRHLGNLAELIGYLAYCAVKDCNDAHLADIQKLIDVAKAGQSAELLKMNRSIQTEMQQLRSEMRQGFETVAQVLDVIDQRHNQLYSALDERLSRLESRSSVLPSEPVVQNYYYHVDNSYTDKSQHSQRESNRNVEALAWTIVAIFFTVLACSILPYGRFYNYAPHCHSWQWCYLLWLDQQSPSAAWIVADVAWESDLQLLLEDKADG